MAVVITGVLAALGALVLEPARASVGPLPAEGLILPADARFLVGLDVKRVTQSPFYKRYSPQGARPEAFGELEVKTGLNPERDVDQLLIAGSPSGPGTGLVMVLGHFDRTKLSHALETEKKSELTWKNHLGTNVYLFREGTKGAGAVAFLDDSSLVMGSQAQVESTIANHAQGSPGLKGNVELLRLLEQVKAGSAFWMVGDQSLLANLPRTLPAPGTSGGGSMTLPDLKSLTVTGELEPAVALSVTGEALDEAAAKNLADIVRGFAAFLTMQAAQKPELKDLASAISVTTEANRVLVNARFPYELLDSLVARKAMGDASPKP
jgi:hypothetical protein